MKKAKPLKINTMLKFIKHNMETIIGIEIFPIISFLIFFIFFCVLFIWVFRIQKSEIKTLSAMPLNDGDLTNEDLFNTKTNDHE